MEIVFVTNLLISIAAGIIVGLERQWQQKLAGIRTTALVSFGSCMFVTLSTFMANDSSPSRVAAQVVSGIGFLAGGVIIRDGFSVSGINTAATLWCSAAIGSMIGAGYPIQGIVAAFMLMLMNIVLRGLSHKVDNFRSDATHYYVSVTCAAEDEVKVRTKIMHTLNALSLNFNQITCGAVKAGRVQILIDLEINANENTTQIRIRNLIEKLLTEYRILQVQNIGEDLTSTAVTPE